MGICIKKFIKTKSIGSWINAPLLVAFMSAWPWSAIGSEAASASKQLDAGWNSFIENLQEARNRLLNEEHFPPDASDRVLAEGYRYLLGHVNRVIEMELRADPEFPEFLRSMDMLRKWTGENPDTMYLKAPIDDTGYYRISGRASNTQEWKTSKRAGKGPKAPRMVTFQTITGVPGGTGELKEMAECKSVTLDFLNTFEIDTDRKGRFEILVGPERPQDYRGNFLVSRKNYTCPSTAQEFVARAKWVALREIFSDWENERPLELDIVRLGSEGKNRPPYSPEKIASTLSKIGSEVANQVRFWNLLMEFPLEMRGDRNNDGSRALPVNGINPPAPPFTAGGVAGAKQIYAAGIFELTEDEALVFKVEAPLEPHYVGFQLNNLWMEGPDQQNYVSSLTGTQLRKSKDGARYYIVAHRDPGYDGWVDTTGLEKGFHAMRFVFRTDPLPEEMPTAHATLVKFDDIHHFLPEGTTKISAEQRRAQIAVRQAHIKRIWGGQ
ncbi:MAG: hypothetical protein ACI9G5_001760 [Paracoccaceae bacterium]|jgi:hypothetical protein